MIKLKLTLLRFINEAADRALVVGLLFGILLSIPVFLFIIVAFPVFIPMFKHQGDLDRDPQKSYVEHISSILNKDLYSEWKSR